jgi:hypothetical protein
VHAYSSASSYLRLPMPRDGSAGTCARQLVLSLGHNPPFVLGDAREGGSLAWYEGASLAQVRVFRPPVRHRPAGEYQPGELPGMAPHLWSLQTWHPVKRGAVSEFSRSSRARLIRLLETVDYACLAFLPKFLTLTYPADFPVEPAIAQSHLEALKKAFYRKFGKFPVVWRREFQERGAPHFHLLLFLRPYVDHLWLKRTWQRIIGSTGRAAFHRGVDIRMPRNLRRVRSYVSKYMAKLPDTTSEPGASLGRSWGVWDKAGLPIHMAWVPLTAPQRFQVRRWFKTLQRKHGYKGLPLGDCGTLEAPPVCRPERVGITTFLPASDARRLAVFLTGPLPALERVPATAGGKKVLRCETSLVVRSPAAKSPDLRIA